MRKLCGVIISIAILFLFASSKPALHAATKKPPYILYDFYADWCGPCKEMEPHVKAFEGKNKDRVVVKKVDVDKKESQKLEEKYHVGGIPRIILTGKAGKLLADREGFMDEKELDEFLARAISFEENLEKMTDTELFEAAKKLIADKKYEESYPYLLNITEKNQDNAVAVSSLAHIYYEDGRYKMASAAYEKIAHTKEFKDDLQKQYEYALSLLQYSYEEKNMTKGKEILANIEKANPDFPGLHYALGRTFGWGNWTDAEKEFFLELEKTPHHIKSLEALLDHYTDQWRWDDAIEIQKKLTKARKTGGFQWGNFMDIRSMALLYLQKGDLKSALREFQKAARNDLSSWSYQDYGWIMELMREEEKAREAYEKVKASMLAESLKNSSIKALRRMERWKGKRKLALFLGFQGTFLNKEKAKNYRLTENTQGFLVQRMYQNSPAESAGISAGDVIQKINGVAIKTFEDFDRILQDAKLGDLLVFETFHFWRVRRFYLLYIPPYQPLYMNLHPSYLSSDDYIKREKRITKNAKYGKFTYPNTKEMQSRIADIEKAFNEALEEVSEFLKVPLEKNFQVHILPSIYEMGTYASDYTEGSVTLGQNIVYAADNPFMKETFVRLIAYTLAVKHLGNQQPGFLMYGLGSYLAGTYEGRNVDDIAKEAFEKNKMVSVEDMMIDEYSISYFERETAFAVAASSIKYLVENYEWEKFKELWKNVRPDNYEEAFKKSFGEPIEDTEKKWLEKIGVETVATSACGETGKCSEAF